jgi:hypothetical protein
MWNDILEEDFCKNFIDSYRKPFFEGTIVELCS